jgi:hypothetical protein
MIDVFAAVLIATTDPGAPELRPAPKTTVDVSTFAVAHPVIDKGVKAATYVPRKIWAGVKKTGHGMCSVGRRAQDSGLNGFLSLVGGCANVATPFAVGAFKR